MDLMGRMTTIKRSMFCSLGLAGWLALVWISGANAISQNQTGEEEQTRACCEIWGKRHDPETVRLELARTREIATVYGDGVVVVDRQSQYRVDPSLVQTLLTELQERGFRDMDEMYGAGKKIVRAHAKLTLGTYQKESVRLLDGRDPEPLTGLIDGLLKRLRPALKDGVGADSFEEALRKIADGELSPRTLRVVALHRPEAEEDTTEEHDGWILRVFDGWIEAERLGAGANRRLPVRRYDTEQAIRDLAGVLLASQAWSLPGNLPAPDYTQLTVEVLRQRQNVLARPFARRDPKSYAAERKRLADLVAHLKGLELSLRASASP